MHLKVFCLSYESLLPRKPRQRCTEEVARRVQEALARIRAAAASALASNRSGEKKAQADAARTIRREAKDIMDLLAACVRANLRSQFADSRGGSKASEGGFVFKFGVSCCLR